MDITRVSGRWARMTGLPILLAAAIAWLVSGCSTTQKPSGTDAKALSGTDEQVFIGDTIEKNYDPNVIMKRAEAFFEKEQYPEAIIEYQHFLDLHRIHVLAPYAQFKLGESHGKLIKTIDRDPDPVHKALEAFEKLRREYPGSRYETQAQEKIRELHESLAQTHLFVGQFYYRREAYLAAAHRFETVVNEHPDLEVAGDALYHLALTYHDLGVDEWAREKLILLAERYPNSKYRGAGEALLAAVNAKQPPAAVASSGPTPQGFSAVTALRAPTAASVLQKTTPCRLGIFC